MGGKRKNFRDYSTTPEIVDWPIKTKDDWKEIKKRLKPDFTRVDWASGLANFNTALEYGQIPLFLRRLRVRPAAELHGIRTTSDGYGR